MGIKESISWADMTWNPVWGCLNSCSYCYARKIAKRFYQKKSEIEIKYCLKKFGKVGLSTEYLLKNFKPIFLESNFNKSFPKKPSRIFVNSMSDIAYWKPEWVEKVLNKIEEYPQHQFLFLTKDIFIYQKYKFPLNCFKGITKTNNIQWVNFDFISFEPIMDNILSDDISRGVLRLFKWVIVGAETGNRKNKIVPKKEWIEEIKEFCQQNKIPYFEKNSLAKIVNRELIQEFPDFN